MSSTLLEPIEKRVLHKKDQPSEEGRPDWLSDPNLNAVLRDVLEIISELIDQNHELKADLKRLKEAHSSEHAERRDIDTQAPR